jgi:hypothetical protein
MKLLHFVYEKLSYSTSDRPLGWLSLLQEYNVQIYLFAYVDLCINQSQKDARRVFRPTMERHPHTFPQIQSTSLKAAFHFDDQHHSELAPGDASVHTFALLSKTEHI